MCQLGLGRDQNGQASEGGARRGLSGAGGTGDCPVLRLACVHVGGRGWQHPWPAGLPLWPSTSLPCRQQLSEEELERLEEACHMALELNASKHRIYEYVESRMSFIAPNLSIIIGASTAAKIMGEARWGVADGWGVDPACPPQGPHVPGQVTSRLGLPSGACGGRRASSFHSTTRHPAVLGMVPPCGPGRADVTVWTGRTPRGF